MIEFSDFDVHQSDALVIYNGALSDNQIIGYLTDLDGELPPNIISLGQAIALALGSSSADSGRGFEFTVSFIDRTFNLYYYIAISYP